MGGRIRSIKPEFASDSRVKRLSREARLMFLLMLPEADDEGRMLGSPKWLAGVLYPDDADVTAAMAQGWVDELAAEEMVMPYSNDGTNYLWITHFKRHQKPQHPSPSKLPTCPHEILMRSSGESHESLMRSSGESHETFAPVVVVGGGEGVVEGEGGASGGAHTAGPAFDDFWPAFPPRDGKRLNRAKCEAIWRKLQPDDQVAAIVGAGHLAAAIAAGGKFGPPDPDRWLRDRRWVEWQEPAKRTGNGSVGTRTLANLALHADRRAGTQPPPELGS